ncbi:MAG TPA: hypothetical protein VMA34_04210 [Terracidiphilus sp.]|nr:hypothetical protein [Terracidiphilus sp.]
MAQKKFLDPSAKPGTKMFEGDGWLLISPKGLYFPAKLCRRFGVGSESVAVFQVKAGPRSPGKRAAATRKANAEASA